MTIGVIAHLISEAQEEILLVSYATYPPADVTAALHAAAARAVTIILLLERPLDMPGFHGSADPFPGLVAERLCWPAAARPPGASLHAKVLVVDRRSPWWVAPT